MAAALLFMGCSSDDTITGEPKTIEQQPTAIQVTVGAGISDGEAATRSTVTKDGSTRTLKFTTGDKLYVVRELADGKHLAGELTMKADELAANGLSATFEGTLKVYSSAGASASYDFGEEDPLTGSTATLLHEGMTLNTDYSINGTTQALTFANATGVAASVDALMTKGLVVSGGYTAGTGYSLNTSSMTQPILNCTISGLQASTTHQFVLKKYSTEVKSVAWTTNASGTASFAFAFASSEGGSNKWTLEVKKGGSTVGSISLGDRKLESKVYNINRQWKENMFVREVDLSGKSSNYTAQNGDMLTGAMPTGYKVTIERGSTVILSSANIDCSSSSNRGISCSGATTIILEGTNTIKGKYGGIISEGSLTIKGSGTLTATGGNGYPGIGCDGSPGIGGDGSSPNLVIENGTITATGGTGAAGIGSRRDGTCGTITISGGTVEDVRGGSNGAGIGSGEGGTCGNIAISGGTVEDVRGGSNGAGIGSGKATSQNNSTCGDITISGGTVMAFGGEQAAGIGSGVGYSSSKKSICGSVTITKGVKTVEATKGSRAPYSVGKGNGDYSTCGTVTIGGTEGPVSDRLNYSGHPK